MSKQVKDYLEKKIQMATPLELVVIAYEGAINKLEDAKKKISGKKIKAANDSIDTAQKIIRELRNSLDMEVEDVAQNLFVLYHNIDKQLTSAIKNKNIEIIDKIIKMLAELKDAWSEIAKNLPVEQKTKPNDTSYLNTYS